MDDFLGFPTRLRTVLKENNLTQVEVSRILDISKHTLTKYLNGRIPETVILYKLAQLCGKPMEWFLTGQPATFSQNIPNVRYAEPPTSSQLADKPPTYELSQPTPDFLFEEWVTIFHNLSPDARAVILGMVRAIIANTEK